MKLRIFLIIAVPSIFLWGCEEWGRDYWRSTVGDDEIARVVASSNDGGYFVAGEKYYGDGDEADLFLARFTENGHTEWMTTYDAGTHTRPLAARETNDHGFLVLARRTQLGHPASVYILKVDADGRVRWDQDVSTGDMHEVITAEVTDDGGFILLGRGGYNDVTTLVRTDYDGRVMFRETYGGGGVPVDVQETSAGGFVILSNLNRNDDSSTVKLTRVNAWGDVNWSSVVWSWGWWTSWHLAEDPDGGYFIIGERNSGTEHSKPMLVKTDAYGHYLWRRDYNEAEGSAVYAVVSTWSGILLVGDMNYGSDHDGFALRTTDHGDWLWWRTYGRSSNDWISAAIPANSGGYVLAGTSASFSPAGDTDIYLAKISSDGSLIWETADGE